MKHASQIVLVVATLAVLAGGGLILARKSSTGGIEIVLPTPAPENAVELEVYISGGVRNPGVYRANEGDRLADVILMAGGTTEDADLDAVNLARRVKDEDHWQIPRLGEGHESGPLQRIDLSEGSI